MKSRLSMTQLNKLHSVMSLMLSAADNADWSELSRLDQQRRVILNYPGQHPSTHGSTRSMKAISSGGRPLALEPRGTRSSEIHYEKRAEEQGPVNESELVVDESYRSLVSEILSLDAAIKSSIDNTKKSMLQQSREIKAQIKARNGYQQTRNMTIHTYS